MSDPGLHASILRSGVTDESQLTSHLRQAIPAIQFLDGNVIRLDLRVDNNYLVGEDARRLARENFLELADQATKIKFIPITKPEMNRVNDAQQPHTDDLPRNLGRKCGTVAGAIGIVQDSDDSVRH